MVLTSGRQSRRTVIVCTAGPALANRQILTQAIEAGADVLRFPMANMTSAMFLEVAKSARAGAKALGRPLSFMADLQRRKNRLFGVTQGRAHWQKAQMVSLASQGGEVAGAEASLNLGWDPAHVKPGTRIEIDDGLVSLEVEGVDKYKLRCRVLVGGWVSDGRGVAILDGAPGASGLSAADQEDLAVASGVGIEAVALSFAEFPQDAARVRQLSPHAMVLGKIETKVGVDAVDDLARAFDALVVARGDLGVNMPWEQLPFAQRRIVQACRRRDKKSVVATELLHSMRSAARPTRAEVADVTTAVREGADALMLTGETAIGAYPVEAIRVLAKIAMEAERDLDQHGQVNDGQP